MTEQKNSILIVDDEPMNVTALSHILSSEYEIYIEIDGGGCVESVKKLKPDLVLLDIIMPGLSGFEVIKILKEDPETRHIPVVFMTGLNSAEDEARGFSMGAVDYITKPFNDAIVKLRIKNQINLYNQMRSIRILSTLDTLTGILNRQHINTLLVQTWEKAKTEQTTIGFMVLGIHKFNNITATFGRLCSDILISEVAQVIDKELKETPYTVARWSGDEFAVLLPQTDAENVSIVGESLQEVVKNKDFYINGQIVELSIHVGTCSAVPSDSITLDDLIANATRSYHRSKLGALNV